MTGLNQVVRVTSRAVISPLLGALLLLASPASPAQTATTSASPPSYRVVTGELAPYAYMHKGKLTGIGAGVVEELMHRLHITRPIEVLPWPRAIDHSTQADQITFPLARLPYREHHYHWIGPLVHDQLVFAMLEKHPGNYPDAASLHDLNIAALHGAPTDVRLHKEGFKHINLTTTETASAKMLIAGRVDAWYSSKLMIEYILRSLNVPASQVRLVPDIRFDMYIVASPDLGGEAKAWQNALDGMKQDGSYQHILAHYSIKP